MISTVDKYTTLRTAKASAKIDASPEAVALCRNRKTPKGDAIEVARTAGVLAAKRTHELIPFCHPIPLDHISVDVKCNKGSIEVVSSATAVSKTGVEMEALTAASVAALTIYDMLKPLYKNISISRIRLVEKRGGKSDFAHDATKGLKAAIIVTSDSRSAGRTRDTTGPAIRTWLTNLGFKASSVTLTPDDRTGITNVLKRYCRTCDLIVTTGGTGIGPRDVTVEATRSIIEREVPGISEAIRNFGQTKTPYSMLSRATAGIKGNTLIVNLPGSLKAVSDSLNILSPAILHMFDMLRGAGH